MLHDFKKLAYYSDTLYKSLVWLKYRLESGIWLLLKMSQTSATGATLNIGDNKLGTCD